MKKKVNLRCSRPFMANHRIFRGTCLGTILDSATIKAAIESKAKVTEILADGSLVPLDFTNYDTDNGPTDITDDSTSIAYNDPNRGVKIENVTISDANRRNAESHTGINPLVKKPASMVLPEAEPETVKKTIEATVEVEETQSAEVENTIDEANDNDVKFKKKKKH